MSVARILEEKGADVFTLSADASIMDAVRELATHRVGALVVTDGGGAILGILSERDVVRAGAETGPGALHQPVSALMTRQVTSTRPRKSGPTSYRQSEPSPIAASVGVPSPDSESRR